MDDLRDRELRALVDFAHEASHVARFEPRRFESWLVQHVAALLPADQVQLTVRRWPYQRDRLQLVSDNAQFSAFRNSAEGRREWGRLVESHPLGAERLRHPTETRALRLSDYATQLQLRQLDVYDLFQRPWALNYCVSGRFFGLSRVYDLAVARSQIDFAGHDLLLLDVVTTVLGLALRESQPPVRHQLVEVGLTAREAQVLAQVARGRSNLEIAAELNLARGTVKKHLDNIFEKLGVRNRIEATRVWTAEAEARVDDRFASSDATALGFSRQSQVGT
jgi:DNA-binding CsgD family transcriptional regulator